MVQTAHQRLANQKFAKLQEKNMGKSENTIKRNKTAKKYQKYGKIALPILALLLFAIVVPHVLEPLRLILSRFF